MGDCMLIPDFYEKGVLFSFSASNKEISEK
jgi:hypothetical protein